MSRRSVSRRIGPATAMFVVALSLLTGPRSSAAPGPAPLPWHEFGLLQTYKHAAYVDAEHDRLITIGGARRGAAELPLTGAPEWHEMTWQPGEPWPYEWHTSTWDPGAGLASFLGLAPGFKLGVYRVDPDLGNASIIAVQGAAPPVTSGTALIFDPVHHRYVAIGVQEDFGGVPRTVWALDLEPAPTWTQWPTAPALAGASSVWAMYDPLRQRAIVFVNSGVTDAWSLSLDASPVWTKLPTDAFDVQEYLANGLAYDAAGDRIVTVGKSGVPHAFSLQTHSWSVLPHVGMAPAPRELAAVAVDAVRNRMLVSGGIEVGYDAVPDDIWALSLAADAGWISVLPRSSRPPIRTGISAALDTQRNRWLVLGGGPINTPLTQVDSELWGLDLTAAPTWSIIPTQGDVPLSRRAVASAYDAVDDRLVVFGGSDILSPFSHVPLDELSILSFTGTPTWTSVAPAGAWPAPRSRATCVFDAARQRYLLMFGQGASDDLRDVWELRLEPTPMWRHMFPAGPLPPARSGAMAVYDSERDRVVVFGGHSRSAPDFFDVFYDDVWGLDLSIGDGTWQLLPTAPGPSRRMDGTLSLDRTNGRALLYGGWGAQDAQSGALGALTDTWSLTLGDIPGWHRLETTGWEARDGDGRASAVYDAPFERLIVFSADRRSDLHALDLRDDPTPTQLALQTFEVTSSSVRLIWSGGDPSLSATIYRRHDAGLWRSLATLMADGNGRWMWEDSEVTGGETYEYRLGVVTDGAETFHGSTRIEVPRAAFSLRGSALNGRVLLEVELPDAEQATLELYDVSGRRVWRCEVGGLGAGRHEVSAGVRPSALYFARLTHGISVRGTKLIVVQ